MHKYCALIIMLVHRLHLVLDLEAIIFNKVDYSHHIVIQEMLKAIFELLILPHGNKVVLYKVLQLWFQIPKKLYKINLHV